MRLALQPGTKAAHFLLADGQRVATAHTLSLSLTDGFFKRVQQSATRRIPERALPRQISIFLRVVLPTGAKGTAVYLFCCKQWATRDEWSGVYRCEYRTGYEDTRSRGEEAASPKRAARRKYLGGGGGRGTAGKDKEYR